MCQVDVQIFQSGVFTYKPQIGTKFTHDKTIWPKHQYLVCGQWPVFDLLALFEFIISHFSENIKQGRAINLHKGPHEKHGTVVEGWANRLNLILLNMISFLLRRNYKKQQILDFCSDATK